MVCSTIRSYSRLLLNRRFPGFLIGPLQQYYIGEETFKFQTASTPGLQGGTDVFDLFSEDPFGNTPLPIALLQNQLASVSTKDFQPNLWQEGILQCANNASNHFITPSECYQGGTTFDNISSLLGPYIAQLPAGYQAGLTSQFLLRMNSSVSFANVSRTKFPQDCATLPSAYYIEYNYNETLLNVQVCMPVRVPGSPWKATRDRQDISEEMYMSITAANRGLTNLDLANQTFKLAVNTTLGYFELPNYDSGGIAGPLLSKDPHTYCRNNIDDCLSQWQSKKRTLLPHQQQQSQYLPLERSVEVNGTNSATFADTLNLGPLAMLTLAMFNPGSFIATQFTNIVPSNDETFLPNSEKTIVPCTVAPLRRFSRDYQCFRRPSSQDEGYKSVSDWLVDFSNIGEMQNALHAGVIIASQSWLNSASGHLVVWYDLGSDSSRPKISTTGVILLSTLIAIDLFLLLAFGAYASFSYTWKSSYNSLAMMRHGAARADKLGLQVWEAEAEQVLETMPGWVGDAASDEDVGVLAIGAEVPLRKGRKYFGGRNILG